MKQLIQKLTDYTRVNGGHEKRHYLGLSQLSRSEEELVQDMINGSQEASDADVLKLASEATWWRKIFANVWKVSDWPCPIRALKFMPTTTNA